MLNKQLADKLVSVAGKQLEQGLSAKSKRMKAIVENYDAYNNKIIEVDSDIFNIPFSFMARIIDQIYSKIDNPPTLDFQLNTQKNLAEKIKAAWKQEMSSTRAAWKRKDRAEKKMALMSGRGVSKVYASSVENKYKSHYDLVDIYSFVADPTRGNLEDGNYHGETDIFRTKADLKLFADKGHYNMNQVKMLLERKDTMKDGQEQVTKNKFDRLKALGIDIETSSFAGQEGVLLTEWVMKYEGEWHYVLFDANTSA